MDRDVRSDILRVATRLFAHRGFDRISVREVVDAAGVTKPALYYYFDSKEGLLREVVTHQMTILRDLVSRALEGTGPISDRIRVFLESYLEAAYDDPDGVRVLMNLRAHNHEGAVFEEVRTNYEGAISALSGLVEQGRASGELRAGVASETAALRLLGGCNLHIQGALGAEAKRIAIASADGACVPAWDAPADARKLFDLFLHGVGS